MGCARGQANPNQNTRLRLFADSAGYCQRPGCTRELFVDLDSGSIHIAEMAHIFAASDDGPRGNAELSEEERGAYENLILLCANCHTMIDKAPNNFPDATIRSWKRERVERLAALFGAVYLPSREVVRTLIELPMRENKHILGKYALDIVLGVSHGAARYVAGGFPPPPEKAGNPTEYGLLFRDEGGVPTILMQIGGGGRLRLRRDGRDWWSARPSDVRWSVYVATTGERYGTRLPNSQRRRTIPSSSAG